MAAGNFDFVVVTSILQYFPKRKYLAARLFRIDHVTLERKFEISIKRSEYCFSNFRAIRLDIPSDNLKMADFNLIELSLGLHYSRMQTKFESRRAARSRLIVDSILRRLSRVGTESQAK